MALAVVGVGAAIGGCLAGRLVDKFSAPIKLALSFWVYLSLLGTAILMVAENNTTLHMVETMLGAATIVLAEMVVSIPCSLRTKTEATVLFGTLTSVVLLCGGQWFLAVILEMLVLAPMYGKTVFAARRFGVYAWLAICTAYFMARTTDAFFIMPIVCTVIGMCFCKGKHSIEDC